MKEQKKSLLILGAGGFGRVVEDLARLLGYEEIAFLDDQARGEHILGSLSSFQQHPAFREAFPALGDNKMRLDWICRLQKAGFSVPVLIHPAAAVSSGALLEDGCIVLAKAVIQTGTRAGKGVLFNCGTIVDHDACIGQGAHLCLGSIVKARCRVPELCKVEAGVVVDEQHPMI